MNRSGMKSLILCSSAASGKHLAPAPVKWEWKIAELCVNISNASRIEVVAAVAQQVPSRGNDF